MLSPPFTLRQLQVFASLAASGSFRASAEALGISQASVSNQIKAMEEQLGFALFDRAPGRRPQLTMRGAAFADDLHGVEAALARLASHRLRGADEPMAARFRLLVGQGMFDAYVRAKLDRFLADNPLIELAFDVQPPSNAWSRTASGEGIDFALINLRADLPIPPQFERLALVRGGIYGHKKHLEDRAVPLSAQEVSRLPFMLPLAGSRQEREVTQLLRQSGVVPGKVVGHSQYYDVMATMMERGLAVASLSEAIVPPWMRESVVQLMPLEDWILAFYRKPAPADPQRDAVEAFLKSSVLDDPAYPALAVYAQKTW